jgi:hypothetical protein
LQQNIEYYHFSAKLTKKKHGCDINPKRFILKILEQMGLITGLFKVTRINFRPFLDRPYEAQRKLDEVGHGT